VRLRRGGRGWYSGHVAVRRAGDRKNLSGALDILWKRFAGCGREDYYRPLRINNPSAQIAGEITVFDLVNWPLIR
jgi:hypothetical protein